MTEALVETAVLFDRSECSRLSMTGADCKDLLHRLSTNDILSLEPGQGAACLLLERSGRLLDRLEVAHRGSDLLLRGSRGRASVIREWIEKFTILEDSKVQDVSALTSEVLLLGPRSSDIVDSAFGVSTAHLNIYGSVKVEPGTSNETTIVRVEDHEGPAYVMISARAAAGSVLDRIGPIAKATEEMLQKLRVKAGLPSWGSELDERTIPLEARLVDAISFTKGCYVGQEIIARVHHHHRVKRFLCRMEIEGDGDVPSGSEIFHEERKVGTTTSSAAGITQCIAMGYVESGLEAPGTLLAVAQGSRRRAGRVLTLNPQGDPRWPT